MSLLGNLIWIVFGGLISAVAYILSGLLICLTVVGIPFGLRSIKMGFEILAPFGKELKDLPAANSPLRLVFNVIWLLLFGWELALNHAFWALLLAITVVGLPFALQHLKLIPLALFPFGREMVAE
ncbi:MAG: YccF domain-containing protein [Myxococcota bacterium]